MNISIIGLRAYPSSFKGTSGIEVYIERVLVKILKSFPLLNFNIYTRTYYQKSVSLKVNSRVRIFEIKTVKSKIFETLIYSFISSIKSIFDKSNVVWFHGVGPAFFSFIPKLFGKKIVITIHSADWGRKKWNFFEKTIFKSMSLITLRYDAVFFAVSKSLTKCLKADFGIKAVYTPPGFILRKNELPLKILKNLRLKSRNYILYLGRIVPEKRLEWLLSTFINYKKDFTDLKLVIVGGHGNIPDYEKKLKDIYVDKDIVWVGYFFGVDKIALLKYCRCFILPSELEGNPISLYEALGVCSWCLVSDKISKEIPKLGNIITYRNKSLESFRNKFVETIDNSQKVYVYNDREINSLSKYSWVKSARKYLRTFLSLEI